MTIHMFGANPVMADLNDVWSGLLARQGGTTQMSIDEIMNEVVIPIQRSSQGLVGAHASLIPLLKLTFEFGSMRNRVVMRTRNLARFVADLVALMDDQTNKAVALIVLMDSHIPKAQ
jgi:hypothetical protein